MTNNHNTALTNQKSDHDSGAYKKSLDGRLPMSRWDPAEVSVDLTKWEAHEAEVLEVGDVGCDTLNAECGSKTHQF